MCGFKPPAVDLAVREPDTLRKTMPFSPATKRFDALLAPYAVHNAGEHGRAYPEAEHPDKLPFQRDRDRIIHSKAFRRLKHKTQVIVSPKSDHYRDRLTHSIEGSQIARSLCRALRLNEDLAEAGILAHDLGHPPFGHEGEYVLHALLEPYGFNFDHNKHSLRIVTVLEHNYPDFPGLNLTAETLNALRKHDTPWEKPGTPVPHGASMEAQIVNLADEISYYSHDIDDGLRAKLISFDQLADLHIGKRVRHLLSRRYPQLTPDHPTFQPQYVRSVVHLLITDIIEYARKELKRLDIKTLEDIYAHPLPLADYSPELKDETLELRRFLYKEFYSSPQVRQHTDEGKNLLAELFNRLMDNSHQLPQKIQDLIDQPDPKPIVIKDYVAGMTDNYARDMVLKLRERLI